MPQTRFAASTIDNQKIEALEQKLRELYQTAKSKFKRFGTFQKVLIKSAKYQARDLVDEQTPEEFAKRKIIEPLIEFLGYEITSETSLVSAVNTRQPDYTIKPRNQDKPILYVEAEPFNSDLRSPGHGISQVEEWLSLRSSKTDYAIATNGVDWILLRYDTVSNRSKEILQISLKPIFLKILNPQSLDQDETLLQIKKLFLTLDTSYFSLILAGYLEEIDKEKEDISKKFYNDYVRFVFGFDSKGNPAEGANLLNKIVRPIGVIDKNARLFAVIFMNRLIFIKFLEEKKIVPANLLGNLLAEYQNSHMMLTFFKMYLQPLFFDVFNKSRNNRSPSIQSIHLYNDIPYLNGGLFRESIESEKDYDIENDGIELVLENLLNNYDFGQEAQINPDILGYIFEKTINFISGTGETDQQKMKGAYYTPDDLVEFILEETVIPVIFKKMVDSLRELGWREAELSGYNTLDDLLDPQNVPRHPAHIMKMIESIDAVRILDPACGSGHFLTGTLSRILRIKESLLRMAGRDIDRCKLKRDIVSKNLFGVDIDENAVEIARLRLWLSIIQEVVDSSHIDTLPNIDFNIFSGNSLIGWLDEGLVTHQLDNLLEDSEICEKLNNLRDYYGEVIQEVEKLLSTSNLQNVVRSYRKLKNLYSFESGERAIRIKDILSKIREKLYGVINSSYIDFLHEGANFNTEELADIGRSLSELTPFHWKIDFQDVLLDGGFDVVIGNPPYGNILKDIEKKIIFHYETKSASEIAANFLERIFPLIRSNGFAGLVLANSIAINKSTATARTLIRNHMSNAKMALFGTRPSKLFKDVEIRVMIFIGEKDQPENEGAIFTTDAIKFTTGQRSSLLTNLSFESTECLTLGQNRIGDNHEDTSLPKVGYATIRNILLKLRDTSKIVIGDRINQEGFEHSLEFRKTGGYWLNALETMPYRSTKIERITFENQIERDFTIMLINSSLFYLYWSTYGNLRDFPRSLLEKFPFPPLEKLNTHLTEIKNLKTNVSQCLVSNFLSETGRVGEFRTARCRREIDEIDELLGIIYGLEQNEIDFVKRYDVHIRA